MCVSITVLIFYTNFLWLFSVLFFYTLGFRLDGFRLITYIIRKAFAVFDSLQVSQFRVDSFSDSGADRDSVAHIVVLLFFYTPGFCSDGIILINYIRKAIGVFDSLQVSRFIFWLESGPKLCHSDLFFYTPRFRLDGIIIINLCLKSARRVWFTSGESIQSWFTFWLESGQRLCHSGFFNRHQGSV